MFNNERFNYDNTDSSFYNLSIVRTDEGLIQGQFGINRNIVKDIIPNNPIPNFFGFDLQPLAFTLQFYHQGEWTYDTKCKVARWFFQNSYKPFYSYDNVEVVYNCMAVGQPMFTHTSTNEGYVTIQFECDAPWAWTPTILQTFDLTSNPSTSIISLTNSSNLLDYKHYPEVEVKLYGDDTSFKLKNMSNEGIEQVFTDLNQGETIYIDNKNKIIKTSVAGIYRYSNFNKQWLELIYGINQIQVTGKCFIKVRSKFPIVS